MFRLSNVATMEAAARTFKPSTLFSSDNMHQIPKTLLRNRYFKSFTIIIFKMAYNF